MIVPKNTVEWPDFDVYYWGHKRSILGGQIFCDASAYAAQMALHENPLVGLLDKIFASLLFVGLFAALVAKGKRLNVAMLIGLIVLYLFAAVFYQLQIGGGPESGIVNRNRTDAPTQLMAEWVERCRGSFWMETDISLRIHSLVGGPVSDGQSGEPESLIFSTDPGSLP